MVGNGSFAIGEAGLKHNGITDKSRFPLEKFSYPYSKPSPRPFNPNHNNIAALKREPVRALKVKSPHYKRASPKPKV